MFAPERGPARADRSYTVAQEVFARLPSGDGLRAVRNARRRRGRWGSFTPPTPRRAELWLLALIALIAGVHLVVLFATNHAPIVFDDELAYQKLAQSLGETGRLALFGKQGLSYSPLYPLLLSPLYAAHLSATEAYDAALVVNCLLFALASFPLYRIARYVLSPTRSLVAVALSALAPLMLYSSYVMSENLAYPLFLFAVWAMLVTVRSPSVRADAVVLALCLICAAARLQFVALFPAALAAVALAALARHPTVGIGRRSALARALGEHALLLVANVLLAVGVIAAYAGSRLIGLTGMYANERGIPAPYPWRVARLFAEHIAALDLSLGVIPFVAMLVAAWLWLRRRTSPQTDAFAAVAASVTAAVIVVTAIAAYGQQFGSDLPRIHERYFFYVEPLFVIALVATLGIPRSASLLRVGIASAAVAVALPTVIPFETVLNRTTGIDSFGLVIYLATKHGVVGATPHALGSALFLAAALGLLYALARPWPLIALLTVAAFFVWVSVVERRDQISSARLATHLAFSAERDWVDAADGGHPAVLVENPRLVGKGFGVEETAFFNLSVGRLYDRCGALLFPQFGEQRFTFAPGGSLLAGGSAIRAAYAVVPSAHGIEGRVLATDARAQLELVEPTDGTLRVARAARSRWSCANGSNH